MLSEANHPVVEGAELTAVDLFAGAGGSTQGLSDAGFRVIGAVENDETAASTFSKNHPSVSISIDDISNLDPSEYLEQLQLSRSELSLLTACPPCQGFSSLGSRDRADQRNNLITEVWRFAAEMQPTAILIENVPGLARDPRWEDLQALAIDHGYGFGSWIVDALDFGVPQRRRRLIGIAIRDRAIQFPETVQELLPRSFSLDVPHASHVIAQAGDISDTTDPWHRARTPTPQVLKRLRKIPAGGDHFDLPDELQLDCHKRLKSAGRTASTGPYSRIPLEGPAPTMTTRCTTAACGRFVHPTEDRALSLREAALLQTFPGNYRFSGTYESMERQIGNAVPVRLAHALGLATRQLLGLGEKTVQHE